MKKRHIGFKHQLPNLFFQYEGKRWEIIHKTDKLYYAVELNTKGQAQGAVKRFSVECVVPQK